VSEILFRFEIPLPSLGNSPNHHCSHRLKAPSIAASRADGARAMRKVLKRGWEAVPVRVKHEWYMALTPFEIAIEQTRRPGKKTIRPIDIVKCRPKDAQNAIGCLKAAVDGFVDAGLVPDDTAKWVQWGDCVLHRNAKAHGGRSCVVITLEAIA